MYAIDHPGFGLSEGLHGYIPSFDAVVDNVIEQFKIMKGEILSPLSSKTRAMLTFPMKFVVDYQFLVVMHRKTGDSGAAPFHIRSVHGRSNCSQSTPKDSN